MATGLFTACGCWPHVPFSWLFLFWVGFCRVPVNIGCGAICLSFIFNWVSKLASYLGGYCPVGEVAFFFPYGSKGKKFCCFNPRKLGNDGFKWFHVGLSILGKWGRLKDSWEIINDWVCKANKGWRLLQSILNSMCQTLFVVSHLYTLSRLILIVSLCIEYSHSFYIGRNWGCDVKKLVSVH